MQEGLGISLGISKETIDEAIGAVGYLGGHATPLGLLRRMKVAEGLELDTKLATTMIEPEAEGMLLELVRRQEFILWMAYITAVETNIHFPSRFRLELWESIQSKDLLERLIYFIGRSLGLDVRVTITTGAGVPRRSKEPKERSLKKVQEKQGDFLRFSPVSDLMPDLPEGCWLCGPNSKFLVQVESREKGVFMPEFPHLLAELHFPLC
ncbi:hypothetical protein [Litorivivens sp.]|uniref:hypothetical protein n=1 Tax=Litorivivens sp. TaxID=2020868 RepID=UPI0035655203